MRQPTAHVLMVAAVILAGQAPAAGAGQSNSRELIVYDGADAPAVRVGITAALRLLPRRPVRIAVIDADDARPEVRPTLLQLDAFVTVGSPVVYVVRQSLLLDGAMQGSAMHTHALAAVLWHEMAHAGGADEREARAGTSSMDELHPGSTSGPGDRACATCRRSTSARTTC